MEDDARSAFGQEKVLGGPGSVWGDVDLVVRPAVVLDQVHPAPEHGGHEGGWLDGAGAGEGGREGGRDECHSILVQVNFWYLHLSHSSLPPSLPPSLPQALVTQLVPFRCVPGKQYNELASLFFTDSDTAIKQCEEGGREGRTDGRRRWRLADSTMGKY